MRNNNSKSVNSKRMILIVLGIFILVYVSISFIFLNRFFFGSKINGIDVSFKTVNEARKKIESQAPSYTLELEGRNGVKGKITGKEIELKPSNYNVIEQFKKNQNFLNWMFSLFTKNQLTSDRLLTFNETLFKEKLDNKDFFINKNVIEPKDATFEYSNGGYKIINEINGNKVNKNLLYEKVKYSILNQQNLLNLDKENCYEKPRFTSKSKEVEEAKSALNKYINSKITYKVGDNIETIDGSISNKWMYTDENMKVAFKSDEINGYINSLASKYDTVGKSRNFVTSTSNQVIVPKGDYGWAIDKVQEAEKLIENLKSGQSIEREPIYSRTAAAHGTNDIGNTYLEINLTKQHMWLYKNGTLVVEGDIVTGNVSKNFATPPGVYSLVYKEKNSTLKGEGYSVKVDFWMPFNGNIGLHNAPWRTEFGKDIYVNNGSHGCVNLSFDVAKKVFDNIEPKTPIVCYNE